MELEYRRLRLQAQLQLILQIAVRLLPGIRERQGTDTGVRGPFEFNRPPNPLGIYKMIGVNAVVAGLGIAGGRLQPVKAEKAFLALAEMRCDLFYKLKRTQIAFACLVCGADDIDK